MTYKYEWQGTKIQVKNTMTRVELSVDGKTQDFYNGLLIKKDKSKAKGEKRSIILNAKNAAGDVVQVKIITGFWKGTICYIFNGREVYRQTVLV